MAVIIHVCWPATRKIAGAVGNGIAGRSVAKDALVSSVGTGPPCLKLDKARESSPLGFRAAIFGGGITVIGSAGGPDLQEEAPAAAYETVAVGDP